MNRCLYVGCFVLLALGSGTSARHRVKFESGDGRPSATCLYDNKTYPGGSRFRPDPCTFCHCPRGGGRANCAIEDCKYEPDCVQYARSPESPCCDACVVHGCRDNDGNVYRPGQLVSLVSCTSCVCPEGGGRIECSHVTCPEPACVDPILVPGSCCPTCPNGANCWLGKEVLPAGKVVKRGRCKTCKCPDEAAPRLSRKKGRRALCSITDC